MVNSSRTSTSETLRRTLKLMQLIPQGQKTTVIELRQKLIEDGTIKVPSIRTIQRDLKLLAEEFPLNIIEDGKVKNYSWDRGVEHWTQPGIGEQESLLLTLAQQNLANILPSDLQNLLDKQFHKADQLLSFDKPDSPYSQWRHKVRIVQGFQPLLPPDLVDGVFSETTRALYKNCWLTIDYCNHAGKESVEKRVQPLGLVQQEQRLYLVCQFHGHSDLRSLALSRINKATCGTETFEPPVDFDLERMEHDGYFGVLRGDPIHLMFTIEASAGKHVLESKLAVDQQAVLMSDGRYRISATVPDTLLLDRWLNSFGDEVKDIQKTKV